MIEAAFISDGDSNQILWHQPRPVCTHVMDIKNIMQYLHTCFVRDVFHVLSGRHREDVAEFVFELLHIIIINISLFCKGWRSQGPDGLSDRHSSVCEAAQRVHEPSALSGECCCCCFLPNNKKHLGDELEAKTKFSAKWMMKRAGELQHLQKTVAAVYSGVLGGGGGGGAAWGRELHWGRVRGQRSALWGQRGAPWINCSLSHRTHSYPCFQSHCTAYCSIFRTIYIVYTDTVPPFFKETLYTFARGLWMFLCLFWDVVTKKHL